MKNPRIVIYTTLWCTYCTRAKQLLEKKGLQYEEILVDTDAVREEMIAKSNRQSVPQIFINDQHIGGYEELAAFNSEGRLDELLKQ